MGVLNCFQTFCRDSLTPRMISDARSSVSEASQLTQYFSQKTTLLIHRIYYGSASGFHKASLPAHMWCNGTQAMRVLSIAVNLMLACHGSCHGLGDPHVQPDYE
ncbi:hypothetical protein CEXT_313681 [Caerostris extrusa]|uniref:Uncharacterized protein n=1 Tax=Caerostris extrusa TaxID=172846 RepID=A0AAV4N2X6_CAEEX|nr:hypothetical protein CEXT_313681 [Caerostris extrusa]